MTCKCQMSTSLNVRQEYNTQVLSYSVKSLTWNQKLKSWHEKVNPALKDYLLTHFSYSVDDFTYTEKC
jgi:hypothetical protein